MDDAATAEDDDDVDLEEGGALEVVVAEVREDEEAREDEYESGIGSESTSGFDI